MGGWRGAAREKVAKERPSRHDRATPGACPGSEGRIRFSPTQFRYGRAAGAPRGSEFFSFLIVTCFKGIFTSQDYYYYILVWWHV